ncbi:MAG: hypothetical protein IPP88_05230 [Betaproteobacteria bacterium]|nr:hypothetical protein [Betaproteobacteria bacterium]
MKWRVFLTCFCLAGVLTAGTAFADQLPEPLVFQLQRLAKLYGAWDEIEEVDGRMIQPVMRGPGDEIALAVFGVQRYGASRRTMQYFAVFVPENKTPYPQHYRLVDVVRVGAPGVRAIERLEAKVTHNQKSGETSISIPALENVKGDAANAPSGKVAIQLVLKNGRLNELGKR